MRPRRMGVFVLRLVALAIALAAPEAGAHPLAPGLLELVEVAPGRFDVTWKISPFRARGAELRIALPERCQPQALARVRHDGASYTARWTVECGPDGLVGERVGVVGLGRSRTDVLLRIALLDGIRHRTVLRPSAADWLVPERAGRLDVVEGYGWLGITHIATGADHLLFVLGLVLLVAELRRLPWTVTAFTLGHSVTLALAALGFARFPQGLIELLIAATVLALAVELARSPQRGGWMRRRPGTAAGVFGLLHGLGFAGALVEVGLPAGEIPLALLSFNLGIEAGQLAFVAAVLLGLAAAARLRPAISSAPGWLARAPVYAMGALASYWCLERAAALLG